MDYATKKFSFRLVSEHARVYNWIRGPRVGAKKRPDWTAIHRAMAMTYRESKRCIVYCKHRDGTSA